MALIKCADCGKDISSDAVSCLYCGKPNDSIIEGTKFRNSFVRGTIGFYKVFITIMLSIVALMFLAFRFYFGLIIIGLMLYFIIKKLNRAKTVFKK